MLSMHLHQLFRKPARTALYLVVIILLTAFFCMSLNLYRNSEHNLKLADESYTAIAIMELYADVDSHGSLIGDIAKAEDYAGYQALTVYGYDLEPIVTAPSVIKYDLRARYGAYSEENIAMKKNGLFPRYQYDVIRFSINSEDNLEANSDGTYKDDEAKRFYNGFFNVATGYHEAKKLNICVKESALDIFTYTSGENYAKGVYIESDIYEGNKELQYYVNDLNALGYGSANDYYLMLEPDTEYIASVGIMYVNENDGSQMDGNGKYRISGLFFSRDPLFCKYTYFYQSNAKQEDIRTEHTDERPFWLYKYDSIKDNDSLLTKFGQISYAYDINAHSFGITTTNDITGIAACALGNMYLFEGRMITDNEYSIGSKVCMISRELAAAQRWRVGSKIKFSFYEYDYFTNATYWSSSLTPMYTYTSPDHFFDSGEYEVVGIYDVRPMTGSSTISEAAISVPWNTIYIPEKSLTNAPAEEDRPVTGALLTIWLENGKIEPFIERMNELGITGAKQGDYEARFTFYDQGYSRIQPSLEALSGTAELLLILSSSLLVIAALLLAFFYAQSQKQSIGTMRLLGCSKARAFAAVMLSALIIAVTGALMGAAMGHALTASVGGSIMANANQTPEEFLAFSAYLAESTLVDVEFALGADAKMSLLTCLAALGLFIAGTLVFVLRYLGKGPRELLPRAGE